MNRIDRLFALATVLQARGLVRAEDLAAHFEVSRRTIYRDVAALSEVGVPVVAHPGQGYSLADGFFLPPVVFTRAEATALALGGRLHASRADGLLVAATETAAAKIAALLPPDARAEVARLTDAVRFPAPPAGEARIDLEEPRLARLRRAIVDRRLVAIRYHGRGRGETTERRVEPRTLTYVDGAWYLAGHCRLRDAERAFRLDRIDHLVALDEPFVGSPTGPDASPPAPVRVRPRFAARAVRWVRERQHWSFVGEEATAGGTVMCYAPDGLDEIAPWLLGWGTAAEVLAPAALRVRLRDEALAVAAALTDPLPATSD